MIFVSGVLVVLDARPEGIIYEKLVPYYVDIFRTIYEGWCVSIHQVSHKTLLKKTFHRLYITLNLLL